MHNYLNLTELRDKIKQLEAVASILEPGPEARNSLREVVNNYSEKFLEGLTTRKVFDPGTGDPAAWEGPIVPEEGTAIEELIRFMEAEVDTPGLDPASEGHLGYIPGGGVFPASLGDYLAAVTNRYAGVFFASPGAVRMENQLIRWMCDLIGYGDGALGNLTSGGSVATLAAIVTARDAKGIKARDFHRCVFYCTSQVHHAVDKAIRIAGLSEAVVHHLPVDERFRMDAAGLVEQIKKDRAAGLLPFALVASAGTTDTGAVDPLGDLADVAEQEDLWYHIDGAYGGFFVLSETVGHLLKDMGRADSVVIDPHKGLFLPYGTGAVLIKKGSLLADAHWYTANYMQDSLRNREEASPAELSPELTKHFRGLRMWLPLKLFGLKPWRASLEEKIWLARYFHAQLQEIPGFETGPEPDLSVVLFRYVPQSGDADAFNQKLTEAIQTEGKVFLSSTRVHDRFYLRLAILSFRTHLSTIDRCLDVLRHWTARLDNQ